MNRWLSSLTNHSCMTGRCWITNKSRRRQTRMALLLKPSHCFRAWKSRVRSDGAIKNFLQTARTRAGTEILSQNVPYSLCEMPEVHPQLTAQCFSKMQVALAYQGADKQSKVAPSYDGTDVLMVYCREESDEEHQAITGVASNDPQRRSRRRGSESSNHRICPE